MDNATLKLGGIETKGKSYEDQTAYEQAGPDLPAGRLSQYSCAVNVGQ